MQPDVLAAVVDAMGALDAGRPEPAPDGTWLVPLDLPRGLPRPGFGCAEAPPDVGFAAHPTPADAGGVQPISLRWRELPAPRTDRMAAQNVSDRPVIIPPGVVLSGGMAQRGVARTARVLPGATVHVDVEALGARWWDEGEVRGGGRLDAVQVALLLQARYGAGPAAASARTALWSLVADDAPADQTGAAPWLATAADAAWALLYEGEVVTAWLPHAGTADRRRIVRGRARGARSADWLVASTVRAAGRGDLVARVLPGASGSDLVVLPADSRLVDRHTAGRSPVGSARGGSHPA